MICDLSHRELVFEWEILESQWSDCVLQWVWTQNTRASNCWAMCCENCLASGHLLCTNKARDMFPVVRSIWQYDYVDTTCDQVLSFKSWLDPPRNMQTLRSALEFAHQRIREQEDEIQQLRGELMRMRNRPVPRWMVCCRHLCSIKSYIWVTIRNVMYSVHPWKRVQKVVLIHSHLHARVCDCLGLFTARVSIPLQAKTLQH